MFIIVAFERTYAIIFIFESIFAKLLIWKEKFSYENPSFGRIRKSVGGSPSSRKTWNTCCERVHHTCIQRTNISTFKMAESSSRREAAFLAFQEDFSGTGMYLFDFSLEMRHVLILRRVSTVQIWKCTAKTHRPSTIVQRKLGEAPDAMRSREFFTFEFTLGGWWILHLTPFSYTWCGTPTNGLQNSAPWWGMVSLHIELLHPHRILCSCTPCCHGSHTFHSPTHECLYRVLPFSWHTLMALCTVVSNRSGWALPSSKRHQTSIRSQICGE